MKKRRDSGLEHLTERGEGAYLVMMVDFVKYATMISIMVGGGLGQKCLLLWDFGIGVELTRFYTIKLCLAC